MRAQRANAGKPQLRYLLTWPKAMEGVARVSEYGASKYDLYNYKLGAPASQQIDCLLRHLSDWWNGKDLDEDALKHGFEIHPLHALAWNAMRMADELPGNPELDDRPHVLIERLKERIKCDSEKTDKTNEG